MNLSPAITKSTQLFVDPKSIRISPQQTIKYWPDNWIGRKTAPTAMSLLRKNHYLAYYTAKLCSAVPRHFTGARHRTEPKWVVTLLYAVSRICEITSLAPTVTESRHQYQDPKSIRITPQNESNTGLTSASTRRACASLRLAGYAGVVQSRMSGSRGRCPQTPTPSTTV